MADEANTEETKQEEVAEEPAQSAPKSNTLLVVIVGAVVVILTPLVSFFVIKSILPPPVKTEKSVEENGKGNPIYDLKPVRVNVAETRGTRIVLLKAHLELSEERLREKIDENEAMIMDRIMLAVSRRTIDELEGDENRELLKKDIMSELNAAIKDKMSGAVLDVYFSEFLIQ